jgi:hypothetical protein
VYLYILLEMYKEQFKPDIAVDRFEVDQNIDEGEEQVDVGETIAKARRDL